MIQILYSGYITDESNENGPFDFAAMFGGAQSVSFVMFAHQGGEADPGAVAKAQVFHADTENGPWEELVTVQATGVGSSAEGIETFNPVTIKPHGKVALAGNGSYNAKGGGIVAVVY